MCMDHMRACVQGDNVYVAARTGRAVQETVAELQVECERPRQVAGVECDVSRPASVARLVSRAQSHFDDGCIDVWINNAGAASPASLPLRLCASAWRRVPCTCVYVLSCRLNPPAVTDSHPLVGAVIVRAVGKLLLLGAPLNSVPSYGGMSHTGWHQPSSGHRRTCAGVSGSFKPFLEADAEDLVAVTRTNLLGALLCTRAATAAIARQSRPGHVFNMDGAGADGGATPMYAAYGATKAGIAHVMGSVAAEAEAAGMHVGVHTLSPGMVLTNLILDGATTQNKQARASFAVVLFSVIACFLAPCGRVFVMR